MSALTLLGPEFAAVAATAAAMRGMRRIADNDSSLWRATVAMVRALAGVLRRPLAIRAWFRALPTLRVELSDSPIADSIRHGLNSHQPWPFRCRAVAAMSLPTTFEAYLTGRSRQALRTNRHHAHALGLSTVRTESRRDARAMIERLAQRHELYEAVGEMGAQLADREFGQLWFALDADGEPIAFAAIAVDGETAQLQTLQVALDLADRSSARYLLSSEIVRGLIEDSVSHFIVDSMLFAGPGVVYLERRLGFDPVNIELTRGARQRTGKSSDDAIKVTADHDPGSGTDS